MVEALKWPTAGVSLVMSPGLARAAFRSAEALQFPQDAPLFAGFAVYVFAWRLLFRNRAWGSLLPTFLHELTHAVFALATFHRVTGLSASWRDGGQVTFRGRGNWLIFVAPYFFPLLVVVVLVALALAPAAPAAPSRALLGAAVGFQLLATWRQTHSGQPDLQRVGYVFSLAFLPAANLLALALVLRFAAAGGEGARAVVTDILWWVDRLIALLA